MNVEFKVVGSIKMLQHTDAAARTRKTQCFNAEFLMSMHLPFLYNCNHNFAGHRLNHVVRRREAIQGYWEGSQYGEVAVWRQKERISIPIASSNR